MSKIKQNLITDFDRIDSSQREEFEFEYDFTQKTQDYPETKSEKETDTKKSIFQLIEESLIYFFAITFVFLLIYIIFFGYAGLICLIHCFSLSIFTISIVLSGVTEMIYYFLAKKSPSIFVLIFGLINFVIGCFQIYNGYLNYKNERFKILLGINKKISFGVFIYYALFSTICMLFGWSIWGEAFENCK